MRPHGCSLCKQLGRGCNCVETFEDYVYFLLAKKSGLVKIGTTSNYKARFASLTAANADEIIVLQIVHGSQRLEKALHVVFHDLREHHEWFRADPRLLDFIEDLKYKQKLYLASLPLPDPRL